MLHALTSPAPAELHAIPAKAAAAARAEQELAADPLVLAEGSIPWATLTFSSQSMTRPGRSCSARWKPSAATPASTPPP